MPYKLNRTMIEKIIAEAIDYVLEVKDRNADAESIVEARADAANQATDDIMDKSVCDEDLDIEIVVEGGCVQEVNGMPDGWTYTINDKDQPDELDGDHVICASNGGEACDCPDKSEPLRKD